MLDEVATAEQEAELLESGFFVEDYDPIDPLDTELSEMMDEQSDHEAAVDDFTALRSFLEDCVDAGVWPWTSKAARATYIQNVIEAHLDHIERVGTDSPRQRIARLQASESRGRSSYLPYGQAFIR